MYNASFQTGVDAFKGPVDLFVPNGNFGVDFGFNLGVPLARQLGWAFKWARAKCSPISKAPCQDDDFSTPTSEIRRETFTTFGLFQRIPDQLQGFPWGFTHDWLRDDYYSTLNFAQWRVKLGVEWNPWNEFGIWAAMPDHGDSADHRLSARCQPVIRLSLAGPREPLLAAHLLQRRQHTARAESPRSRAISVFGADARLPLTDRLSMVGNFTYICTATGVRNGQFDELWNVSFGIEFVPGGVAALPEVPFSPLMPVADNGSMAVRVLPQ